MKNTRGRHPETTATLAHGVPVRVAGGRARPPARTSEEPAAFQNDPFANTRPGAREYREQQQIREAWEARQAP